MRTYGRTSNPDGSLTWVEVTTDANGFNDSVWLTTLIQNLKGVLGESPFFGNYGIPQIQSVITQIFPDFYVMQTQVQFAPFFAGLSIVRQPTSFPPVYNATVLLNNGSLVNAEIPT